MNPNAEVSRHPSYLLNNLNRAGDEIRDAIRVIVSNSTPKDGNHAIKARALRRKRVCVPGVWVVG